MREVGAPHQCPRVNEQRSGWGDSTLAINSFNRLFSHKLSLSHGQRESSSGRANKVDTFRASLDELFDQHWNGFNFNLHVSVGKKKIIYLK